jgi:hypothetical protein
VEWRLVVGVRVLGGGARRRSFNWPVALAVLGVEKKRKRVLLKGERLWVLDEWFYG